MEDAEQNRSESPTPYKLLRARERGSVARGTDLAFLTGLSAFFGFFWIRGEAATAQIGQGAQRALVAAANVVDTPSALMAVVGDLFSAAARPVAFMAATIFIVVLAFEIAQTGLVFSFQPMKADFSRLNPGQNLKRLFSVRLLIETAKTVLKTAVYLTMAFVVLQRVRHVTVGEVTDARSLALAMRSTALRLMLFFAAAAIVFAAFDQFIARRDFFQKMRMSRREVKREVRDREGDARMKQRRKQLHSEFSKISQSLRNIKGADLLITNPTHYAVALRYDPKTMKAPIIVARGSHHIALRLKRLAFLYGVVIIEKRVLARALYGLGDIDREVPEGLYQGVADAYHEMRTRKFKPGIA